MCIFITLIAKSKDRKLVSDLLIAADRRAELVNNPTLRKNIKSDEIQLLTTNGHCDCDTVLGYGPADISEPNFKNEIRKLKRKKWSDAKIEKYILNRRKAEEKKTKSRIEQASDSFELWENLILDSCTQGAGKIGLFYAMYSGTIETQRFDLSVKATKLSRDVLRDMAENEIHYFV